MIDTDVISIKLLDREYQVKCPPEKVADLQEAANYLDAKMRESCEGSKTVNLDRIFMIAALNISNEIVNLKRQKNCYIDNMSKRIQDIQEKIDSALSQ